MDSENTSTPAHGIQYTGLAHSSSEINPNLKEIPPASTFTEKALPLHANITHSPPKLLEDGESERVDDPGHIGTLTLVPCTFADGSLGWKGRRKVNVELLNIQPGEKAPVVDVALFVSAKVVNDKGVEASTSTRVGEAAGSGGAEGYESDNDDSSMIA